ncbi:MAG TPA: hypothetical protein VMR21_16445 [Vicinamibacteria bacterium]|nr:hypothetical protein [Vicinamibacteria bacterium]
MWPPERLRAEVGARVRPAPPPPDAAHVAGEVVRAGGDAVRAIVFFGSRKTQARPDAYSAYDLFVVLSAYGPFYRSLRAAGRSRHPPALPAVLNSWLPPNQVSIPVRLPDGTPVLGKCAVVTEGALRRGTARGRKDHFMAGRLFQPTEVLYAADAVAGESVLDALVSAHAITYDWARPWLPVRFDVADYCRTLLRVSYAGEIRPEPEGRADLLWQAQEGYLRPVYGVLLEDLAQRGELLAAGEGAYALARPVGRAERVRARLFFQWSLVRSTARWAKYVVTFEDWVEFLLRKARRHSGQPIELTERERRLPLIFLWPRVIDYLRHKDRPGRG